MKLTETQRKKLLIGMKKGKESCLCQLMDSYIPYVVKIVTSIGGKILTAEDVEEITSDVFYAVWQNRNNLQIEVEFSPYLAQIARNKTKNKLRALSSQVSGSGMEFGELAEESSLLDDVICAEQVEHLQSVVNSFGSPEKEILYGYYFYDFKLSELAKRLDLPLSTVKSKLYRSREKLKQQLSEGDRYETTISAHV